MATAAQIGAVVDIMLEVFESDTEIFRASLEAIKVNTQRVTIENQIEAIREDMRQYTDQKEAEIQTLLNMK